MLGAVVFGAGNVGRGFLGQLLTESGYAVTFIDVDDRLVHLLNQRGRYTIRMVTDLECRDLTIGGVCALLVGQRHEVIEAIAGADLGATAVGAGALPSVAPILAAGICERFTRGIQRPFNVVVCENLKDAAAKLRSMVRGHMPASTLSSFDEQVGFVDAVVARMGRLPAPEERERDFTLVVVEPYKHLPVDRAGFVGPLPDIAGFEPQGNFRACVDRKLYLHNAIHTMVGYLGYRRRHSFCYQALSDPVIRPLVDNATHESQAALTAEHGFERISLQQHAEDLLARMANKTLGDTVYRLARDPLRKLSRDDRLVGAACLAHAHGVEPGALAWGIAAGLLYDDPNDPAAMKLQYMISNDGLDATLGSVCGLVATGRVATLVRDRYHTLQKGEWVMVSQLPE